MKVLDWSPESDSFLKKKEIEIHNLYHGELAKNSFQKKEIFGRRSIKMRIRALKRLLRMTGHSTFTGKVLDAGAGDGWCSAYLLENYPSLEEIYTMEINENAIQSLIPKVIDTVNGDNEKVNLVRGSFNNIPLKNHFDYVITMGALHHSDNLYQSFKAIFDSLKDGGYFLAQEPFLRDTVSNDFYHNRGAETINFKGLVEVKNDDRTDIFYRLCEYRTAAYHAGFDIEVKDISLDRANWRRIFMNAVKGKTQTYNLVFCAHKPKAARPRVPTAWAE